MQVVEVPHFTKTVEHGGCGPSGGVRVRMRQHDMGRVAKINDFTLDGDAARAGQHTHLLSPCLYALYSDFHNSSRHAIDLLLFGKAISSASGRRFMAP